MQDNAAQQCWYSAIMVANSTLNTDKLVKIVHPHFFGEDGCSNLHQSLRKLMIAGDEDTCDQSGKPPTPPFSLYSAYNYYFHSLWTAHANSPWNGNSPSN